MQTTVIFCATACQEKRTKDFMIKAVKMVLYVSIETTQDSN
jgi:hypothetical protein